MSHLLKSRLRRYPLYLVIFCIILLFSFQSLLTKALVSYKPQITKTLSSILGYRVKFNDINFSLFSGIKISNIFVYDSKQPVIYFKNLSISLKLIPLFSGRVMPESININNALLLLRKEKEGLNLQIIFSDINKRLLKSNRLASYFDLSNTLIHVGVAKIKYLDDQYRQSSINIELRGAKIDFNLDKIKFSSDVRLRYRVPDQLYVARFFRNRNLDQHFKVVAHANIHGTNLELGMITVNVGRSQLVGMGLNKGFMEKNPFLDVMFMPSSVTLEHIPFIENNFGSSGDVFMALKLIGPMDDTRPFLNLLLEDCSFRYPISNGEIFEMKQFNGELEYRDGLFLIDHAEFKLNDLPLSIKFKAYTVENSDFYLYITLPPKFLSAQNQFLKKLEVAFRGKIKKTLQGDVEVNSLYVRKDLKIDLRGLFKNVDFDYYNSADKYFNAEKVTFVNFNPNKVQKLNFSNFKSKIRINKNRFAIHNINFSGYDGVFNAGLSIEIKDKALINAQIIGHRLNAGPLIQDSNFTDKLLSGIMEAKITFDNTKNEFLKGNCFIKDGTCNLTSLTNIIKLPPLDNKFFNIMHAYYAISKDVIRFRGITLLSPEIMLNGHWNGNGKLEGVLNLQISAELLEESIQFKRLLNLSRYKLPFVDFKFEIGGTPKAVRLMWVRGEFRDKIKKQLPSWAKRTIEDSLDGAIEDLANVQ